MCSAVGRWIDLSFWRTRRCGLLAPPCLHFSHCRMNFCASLWIYSFFSHRCLNLKCAPFRADLSPCLPLHWTSYPPPAFTPPACPLPYCVRGSNRRAGCFRSAASNFSLRYFISTPSFPLLIRRLLPPPQSSCFPNRSPSSGLCCRLYLSPISLCPSTEAMTLLMCFYPLSCNFRQIACRRETRACSRTCGSQAFG